jgi:adenylate cyclase
LTDKLLNSLSRVPELQVIARTTSFALKRKNLSVQKIEDSLAVNFLVEESVRKAGNKIKVTAQLINPQLDDPI